MAKVSSAAARAAAIIVWLDAAPASAAEQIEEVLVTARKVEESQ